MLIPRRRTAPLTLLAASRSGAFVAALSTQSGVAAAEPRDPATPAERLVLEYRAAPECPAETRFRAEVGARLERPLEWTSIEPSKRLHVRIERAARGYRAALRVEPVGSTASERAFETGTCDEALIAVALVAALAIDPAASTASGSALPASEEPPSALPENTPAAAPTAPAPRPPTRAPRPPTRVTNAARRPSQELAVPPERGEKPPSRAMPGYAFDLGASVALTWGEAPVALALAGIRVGLAERAERWVAPRFELSALFARTGVIGPSAEAGTFTTLLARACACPVRVPATGALFLQPCATLDAGWIIARGNEDENIEPITAGRLLVASGPSVQATARQGRWLATITLGALVTITRNDYVFENPRLLVDEADRVAPLAQASFGVVW